MPQKQLPLNRLAIQDYLPHRDPMLLVDRVITLSEMSITTEYDVAPDAPYFKGHFPNNPVMPGVLIIESIAQAGALLVALSHTLEDDKFIAFSSVEAAKFKRPVKPNSVLRTTVAIDKIRLPFYKFSGQAHINDAVVCTVKFAAAQMTVTSEG